MSDLAKAVEEFYFKSRIDELEGKIVGPLLVAFFKCEERFIQLLTVSQLFFVFQSTQTSIKMKTIEDFFSREPLRRNIDYAISSYLIDEKIGKKFHALHDQRNSLSHFKGTDNRPLNKFTKDVQKQFLADCALVRKAIDERVKFVIESLNQALGIKLKEGDESKQP